MREGGDDESDSWVLWAFGVRYRLASSICDASILRSTLIWFVFETLATEEPAGGVGDE